MQSNRKICCQKTYSQITRIETKDEESSLFLSYFALDKRNYPIRKGSYEYNGVLQTVL